jgi:hypothetical protein
VLRARSRVEAEDGKPHVVIMRYRLGGRCPSSYTDSPSTR